MFYQIRVGGHLDTGWTDWLSGLSIAAQPDGSTLLSGTLPDQSALHGVLNKLYSLGLTLLAIQCNPVDRDDSHTNK